MIDFTLSPSQAKTQQTARSFAQNVLKDAKVAYGKATDQKSRFQATRPLYGVAVREGLVKAQVPVALGGTSESLIDAAITLEELFAVESAASITVVATALGLMPLMLAGTPSLHEKYLKPFLSKEGEPLASLMHSEPAGTANWLEKGGLGLQTTARKQGDDWIINGEKVRFLFCILFQILRALITNSPCSSGPRTVQAGMTRARTSPASYAGSLITRANHKILRLIRPL